MFHIEISIPYHALTKHAIPYHALIQNNKKKLKSPDQAAVNW